MAEQSVGDLGVRAYTVSDRTIAIEVTLGVTPAAPDELVSRKNSGLPHATWTALVRSGELPARRLGREYFTTRSALLALVAAKAAPAADDDVGRALADLATKRKRKRGAR